MERQKRRWWTRGITWLSLIAISGALLSGLFQLAVALAPGYRHDIAARASVALGQPVQVDTLALRWRWLWPLLELKGVRLLEADDGAAIVNVERIRLGFALAELLRGEWVPGQVEIDGVTLALEVTPEGQLRLSGRTSGHPPPTYSEIARALKRFARLRAENVRINVHDQREASSRYGATLHHGDLRMDEQGFELRAEIQAPDAVATRLRFRAGMVGDLEQPQSWQGRWSVDANGITQGALLLHQVPALAQLHWSEATLTASGDWQQGHPAASELSLQVPRLGLSDASPPLLSDVDIGLRYRPTEQGGTIDVAPLRLSGRRGLWPATTVRLQWQKPPALDETQPPASTWNLRSDFLRLDDLAPVLATLLPESKSKVDLDWASLKGDVRQLEGDWTHAPEQLPRYRLQAQFAELGLRWPDRAAVQGLSGEISADESGGKATLHSAGLQFEFPQILAGSQHASHFDTQLQWQRQDEAWQVVWPKLTWALLGSRGESSGTLELGRNSPPQLALKAQFDAANVASLKPLMPLRWGQPLKDWLNRAVQRGQVRQAQLRIDGPLHDFPFHAHPTGQWSLDLPLTGAQLNFHRDWPGVDKLAANLKFAGNGLQFAAERGVSQGVVLSKVQGGIADFSSSPLVLDGHAAAEAAAGYGYLRATPLAARLEGLLKHSEAEGPVETDLHLEVPLHGEDGGQTVARGEVHLSGNRFRHFAIDQAVENVQGTLRFGGGVGVAAEALQGSLYDTPLSARIATNPEGSDELEVKMRVGYAKANGLAARYVPSWLLQQLQGEADWTMAVPLSGPRSGHVQLSSSLVGVRSLLPVPLGKLPGESMPLTLDLSGDAAAPLTIKGAIPERLGVAMQFAESVSGQPPALRALHLRLGPGPQPALPSQNGWKLDAQLETFEPAAWLPLVADIRGQAGGETPPAAPTLPFLGGDISARRLRLAGYDMLKAHVSAAQAGERMTALLSGEGSSGRLQLDPTANVLTARFDQLQLLAAPKAEATADEDQSDPADPSQTPTLDIGIEKLSFAGQPFGTLKLLTERQTSGQRLKTLTLQGGIASLSAEGEWRRSAGMTQAQSQFTLDSDDLAGTLEALGFAATVSGRNAHIAGDLTWPAASRGFDWAQGQGTVQLAVEDGALRTVDPGSTSRVLGLFNFYALPRRLTLGFDDVVSQGLGFDRIEGQFQLANGVAHTDDLTVRGPSVRIEVRGDVGLAAHDYNQVITVRPNTKGLTLGALLLGGATAVAVPIMPLLAVIANQVIDKPLGQVTQLTYGLTGSWDNPEINKLDQPPDEEPIPSTDEAPKP
jgi:uncharacterized protein (TIGR02099 family)